MAFSNSFHSSAKSHSIGSAASLAGAEKHNERGYYSRYYSSDKISTVIGGPGLAASVKDFINETFDPFIEAHNAKQKRKDRRIEGSAFDYFCNNKKLDIAAESIFQIGDMEFWSRWRQETIIQVKEKEIVLKNFPPEVKAVMDQIYRRQMEAFEQIYETNSAEILSKIELQYARSKAVLDAFDKEPELADRFTKIAEMKKSDDRTAAVLALPPEEQARFGDFFSAYHSVKDIIRKRLRERISEGQMHIKLINGTTHYDEWSPHAHGISVCWADGFQNGLPSRVAKALVLNRYTLEVLQDKMHEIAQEEIAKHPEIFGDEQLKDKGEGRNMDWSKEQIIRQKQAQLLQNTSELESKRSRLTGELGMMEIRKADIADSIQAAQVTAADLQKQNTALTSENERLRSHGKKIYNAINTLSELKTETEYHAKAAENAVGIESVRNGVNDMLQFAKKKKLSLPDTRELMDTFFAAIKDMLTKLRYGIQQLKVFEMLYKKLFGPGKMEPVSVIQERSLEDTIRNAYIQAGGTGADGRRDKEHALPGF